MLVRCGVIECERPAMPGRLKCRTCLLKERERVRKAKKERDQ